VLSDHERRFLSTRRVGHLATADREAIPHVVPVCFTISQGTLYITIDEKPKRVAGPALKRVRNIECNPMVAYMRRRESRGFFVIKHSFLPSVQKAHASASLH